MPAATPEEAHALAAFVAASHDAVSARIEQLRHNAPDAFVLRVTLAVARGALARLRDQLAAGRVSIDLRMPLAAADEDGERDDVRALYRSGLESIAPVLARIEAAGIVVDHDWSADPTFAAPAAEGAPAFVSASFAPTTTTRH